MNQQNEESVLRSKLSSENHINKYCIKISNNVSVLTHYFRWQQFKFVDAETNSL